MRTLPLLLVALPLLAACAPFAPREVTRDRSPDELVQRVREAAQDGRWGDLYDHLGERLQEKWSRLEFRIGFPTQTLPPPHGYKVADVVAKGSCDGVFIDPMNPDRGVVYYSYKEKDKPRFEVKILIDREDGCWRIDGI